jgi:hypothetical protein
VAAPLVASDQPPAAQQALTSGLIAATWRMLSKAQVATARQPGGTNVQGRQTKVR